VIGSILLHPSVLNVIVYWLIVQLAFIVISVSGIEVGNSGSQPANVYPCFVGAVTEIVSQYFLLIGLITLPPSTLNVIVYVFSVQSATYTTSLAGILDAFVNVC
jgi:hypothetical protein